jgi:hypothetical protein
LRLGCCEPLRWCRTTWCRCRPQPLVAFGELENDVSSLGRHASMQLSPPTTCTTADETGAHLVIEVSTAILRSGLSLPQEAHIVYLSWTPRSPCRFTDRGICQAGLGHIEADGSVCREPTCHLSRPKPIDLVELRRLCTDPSHQSGRTSAYRSSSLADAASGLLGCFETLSSLAAHCICAFPWERRK